MGITALLFHPSRFFPAESLDLTVTSSPVYPPGYWNNVSSAEPKLKSIFNEQLYKLYFAWKKKRALLNLLKLKHGKVILINLAPQLSSIKSINLNFFLRNQHKTNHLNTLEVTEVKIKAWLSNFNKVSPTAEVDQPHKTLTPCLRNTTWNNHPLRYNHRKTKLCLCEMEENKTLQKKKNIYEWFMHLTECIFVNVNWFDPKLYWCTSGRLVAVLFFITLYKANAKKCIHTL